MDISDKIAIAAVVISIITAIFSGSLTWRANKISNEANDTSNKALAMSHEAQYNEFYSTVKRTLEIFLIIEKDIDSYPDKDITFIIDKQNIINKAISTIKREPMYKSPTKHILYETELHSKLNELQKESNNILDQIEDSDSGNLGGKDFGNQREIVEQIISYLKGTLKEIED
ncbi:hypothetical protein [Aerococcus viridans]|uniref:hypothetical protein n=1 Tax=Aerococcus viridans TaxID=1377 RepID=UPI00223B8728|nr:hypothetical protein [Aerococcus viridans]MCT1798488.1 hypothetical protein [Aerococcus viridans]